MHNGSICIDTDIVNDSMSNKELNEIIRILIK